MSMFYGDQLDYIYWMNFLAGILGMGEVLTLVDGVTPPVAVPGSAQIYVDIADGVLKVRHGSGTIVSLEGAGGSGTFDTYAAQLAVGSILANTATIHFDFSASPSQISAYVIDASITYAKIQAVGANKLLGSIAGGTVEEIACTAAARTFLACADAAAERAALGLGSMAVEATAAWLSKAGNLAGLADVAVSRANLGLGSAATYAAGAFATAAQGAEADSAVQPARRVDTTAPLAGGGDLSADRTITLSLGDGLYVEGGKLKSAFHYDPLVVEVFT